MEHKEHQSICDRAEDIVSYLYGEASEIEARSFERHMADCSACRREMEAFGAAHASFGVGRNTAAQTFAPLSLDFLADDVAVMDRSQRVSQTPSRSAYAALREFFRFAPVWMQTGAVAATLAFCALISLAVFNSEINIGGTRLALSPARDARGVVRSAESNSASPVNFYTKDEVDAMVNARVREVVARLADEGAGQTEIANETNTTSRATATIARPKRAQALEQVARNDADEPTPDFSRRQDDDELHLTDLLGEVQ